MLSTLLSTSTAPEWMKDLSDHIELILENAKKVDRCREDLHNTYISWLRISDDTIRTITSIRDEIVRANLTSNYVHVGGASGGIAGGILGLVGRVAAIPDRETSLILMGGLLTVTGTVASVGSNIKRNASTKRLCTLAAENLEANKKYTASFDKEYKIYFDALGQFDSFFKTAGGNDVALSLFYEFAEDEEFGLLDDLTPNRWSKNKVRSALQKIIESDVTKLVPRMWSSEFLRYSDSELKSLGEKIRNRLALLRTYIEKDPYLSRLFCNKLRNFLMKEFRHTDKPELEYVLQILSTLRVGDRASVGSGDYLNIELSLKEMADVIRVGLMVYFLRSVSPIFIIIGLIDLIKSLLNLENDSQSDESKNVTEILNDLKRIRKDVIHQMGKNFGW